MSFYYHPPMKLRRGNVFSHSCLSIILSTGGSHVIIIYDVLDLTVQLPTNPPPVLAYHGTLLDWHNPLPTPTWYPLALAQPPVLSGGHHWRPVQTCSFQDPHPPVLTSCGYCSTMIGANGWYGSYWNAFLLFICFWMG